MKRVLLGLVCSFWMVALAAPYPLSLKDDLGRNITLKAQPGRIITMLPSLTETLCAMGACGRIVAVDDYSDWPEQVKKLPKIGGLYNPNPEAIVALRPDLVLVSKYGKVQETLEKAGITTFALDAEGYDDIFRATRTLGQLLNLSAASERLIAQIQRDVYKAESLVANVKNRPTVYYEIDPTPYSVGADSFIGALIAKARGINVIPKELGAFPQVSPELVVQKNPSLIVVTHPGAAELSKRPGWSNIAAIKNNRVCTFLGEKDNLLSRPGPRVAEGLRLLIECFHGKK